MLDPPSPLPACRPTSLLSNSVTRVVFTVLTFILFFFLFSFSAQCFTRFVVDSFHCGWTILALTKIGKKKKTNVLDANCQPNSSKSSSDVSYCRSRGSGSKTGIKSTIRYYILGRRYYILISEKKMTHGLRL